LQNPPTNLAGRTSQIDDWAMVTATEMKEAGGAGLLAHYNGMLGEALKDTFPQIPIDLTAFFKTQKSPGFWKDINVQRKFFDALAVKLGVKKVSSGMKI
jgi:hypothetical protein